MFVKSQGRREEIKTGTNKTKQTKKHWALSLFKIKPNKEEVS